MPQVKQDSEVVRAQILQAARERFTQYGFGKTTMAEIATDCGMSAANLYRYFENKHDIGAAMACQCLDEEAAVLGNVVEDDRLTAAGKISEFLLVGLRYTHERWSSQQHMSELVDAITEKRADIVEKHIAHRQALISRIIKQGIDADEFGVNDPDACAEAVISATFLFDYPNMMGLYPLDEFEQKALRVADLLLDGLKKC